MRLPQVLIIWQWSRSETYKKFSWFFTKNVIKELEDGSERYWMAKSPGSERVWKFLHKRPRKNCQKAAGIMTGHNSLMSHVYEMGDACRNKNVMVSPLHLSDRDRELIWKLDVRALSNLDRISFWQLSPRRPFFKKIARLQMKMRSLNFDNNGHSGQVDSDVGLTSGSQQR